MYLRRFLDEESTKDSKTYANLMAAFAGESMARNKYTYYASGKKRVRTDCAIFEETANQEKNMPSLSISILMESGYYREPERCKLQVKL